MPAGRPTDYDESLNIQAEKLCKLGATDKELSDFFEISETTLNTWKSKYPEFLLSIKRGKEIADMEVGTKLFERATGYEHTEDVIMQYQGDPVIVNTVKHYPPETAAMIFWLKNRRPDKWRDKTEVQATVQAVQKFKIGGQEINFE